MRLGEVAFSQRAFYGLGMLAGPNVPLRFVSAFGVLLAAGLRMAAGPELCVGFGDLPTNSVFIVSNKFVSGSVNCEVERFQWSAGQWTAMGFARVASDNYVNIAAQRPFLWLGNVNIRFDVSVATDLRLKYGAFGGNQNLRINSAMTNFGVMQQVNGITLGGVKVLLIPVSTGRGELRLSGIIFDFAIGGQEFAIDDICISPYVGPKFRQIAIGPTDDLIMTFSYPGTDGSTLVLEWAESFESGGGWSVDSNATIVSTSANWFRATTPRQPAAHRVFYRLK